MKYTFFEFQVLAELEEIKDEIKKIRKWEKNMSAQLDALVTEVAAVKSAEDSAVILINGIVEKLEELSEQLAQANIDTTVLDQLTADLKTSTDPLAAAVVANTPTA